jgi:hypothetical protein
MLLKLIACNVFQREVCWCLSQSPHVIDVEFTEVGQHVRSEALRALIQTAIDAAETGGKAYDAILLLFGLCGNTTIGLHARKTRLVIPRAHDCATILLGSRAQFEKHFKDAPSTPFSSAGYFERGEFFLRVADGISTVQYGNSYAALVDHYGEEKARYVWEALHPPALQSETDRAVFIELPQTAALGHAAKFREKAEAEGKQYTCLQGDIRLIRNLLFGQWDTEEYLIVPPGHKTLGVYDWSEIIRAEPRNEKKE